MTPVRLPSFNLPITFPDPSISLGIPYTYADLPGTILSEVEEEER